VRRRNGPAACLLGAAKDWHTCSRLQVRHMRSWNAPDCLGRRRPRSGCL